MSNKVNWLRVAVVYIGTMVGAGFATGQEVQLYFDSTDVFTIIVASVTAGLLCSLMLYAGKRRVLNEKFESILGGIFAVSGMLTVGIMLSAIKEITHSPFIVLISLVVCMIISVFGNKAMKIFNIIAVPVIIVAVFVVSIINKGKIEGNFLFFRGFSYSCMNIFFESALMYREGKEMTIKDISLCGVAVAVGLNILIVCMRKACVPIHEIMPFLVSSKAHGLGWLAYIVIIFAIYSTMVNCLEISLDFGKMHFDKTIVYAFIFVLCFLISVFPFDSMVSAIYPFFSYFGIGLGVLIVVLLFKERLKRTAKPEKLNKLVLNKKK